MQSSFLFFPYRLSFSKIGIIDEENRITKMVNIEHVTELEKKMFCFLPRKKPWVSLQKSIGNIYIYIYIYMTDGRKSVSIRPMRLRFFCVEKYWGQLQVKRLE